jgi:hypothetical protein
MPQRGAPPTDLRAALRGLRAFLLDLDGVIVLAGKGIPGASEAIAELERRGVPYRIVTNTSAVSRATLSKWSGRLGASIPPERFESALSASAAWTARQFPGQPLYVLASDDAKQEFLGQRLLTHDEAGAKGALAAAIVIGDSPEEATYDNLNRAFRLVLGGAVLVGMHRNPWWLTPEGRRSIRAPSWPVSSSRRNDVRRSSASRRPRSTARRFATFGARRAPGCVGRPSPWSETTSAPTSAPHSGRGCAGSSYGPASTGSRTSRSPPASAAVDVPTPSRPRWRRSSPR